MLERNEESRYAVKFACLDNLVPKGRKIEKAVNFRGFVTMCGRLSAPEEQGGYPSIAA